MTDETDETDALVGIAIAWVLPREGAPRFVAEALGRAIRDALEDRRDIMISLTYRRFRVTGPYGELRVDVIWDPDKGILVRT